MIASRVIIFSAALSAVTIAGAHADPASFVGKWRWNQAESTMVAGEPPPKEIVLDIAEAASGKLKWTVTETDPQGEKHVESFSGAANGAPGVLTGGGDQTSASFTMTDAVLSAVFKSPDGGSDSWSCSVSPDQRKMMCKGAETDGQHPPQPYSDVYDRS